MGSTRKNLSRLVAVAAAALALVPAAGAEGRGLTLGIGEQDAFSADPSEPLLERMRGTGARIARAAVFWRTVAPGGASRPAGFAARDPANPHYRWERVDGFVRGTAAKGMEPLLALYAAPNWAEGLDEADRERRRGADGTYRPNPAHYGDFAYAVARRYDGSFPDPRRPGETLPRVRYFQAWNEPNFGQYLTMPEGSPSADASKHYVRLLNALYAGVNRVHKSNFVITAGTGPYGYNGTATDVDPQIFIRGMFCLRRTSRGLRPTRRCDVPRPRFDALGHHPYTLGGDPRSPGESPDAGALGNLGDIRRILRYAEEHERVSPRGRKELWATEFGWYSDPPGHPLAKPLDVHARYTSESLWQLYRNGFTTVVWYALADKPSWPGGLYFADDTPKPALRAFRFPFAAIQRRRRLELWGALPPATRARVEIARRSGGRWRRQVVLEAASSGIFRRRVRRWRGGTYRARVLSGPRRGALSHPFRVTRR